MVIGEKRRVLGEPRWSMQGTNSNGESPLVYTHKCKYNLVSSSAVVCVLPVTTWVIMDCLTCLPMIIVGYICGRHVVCEC